MKIETISPNLALDISLSTDKTTLVLKVNGYEHTADLTKTKEDTFADLVSLYSNIRKAKGFDRYVVFYNGLPFLCTEFFTVLKVEDFPSADNLPLDTVIDRMLRFFTEFEFTPNFRFLNTLAYRIADNTASDYIVNYFRLMDNPCAKDIAKKITSTEFKGILRQLENRVPSTPINSRFKVYYGNAGTGKTTKAVKETEGRCIVCNSSMLPSDLMEDFVFDEGKATFKPSALWRCMEEGRAITLDEINLLPYDSLRFLQGILDGKKEFIYKGMTVNVADGFTIIGTMNLTVNGATFNLPEPLVDRCSEIKEFVLTAQDLMSAFN